MRVEGRGQPVAGSFLLVGSRDQTQVARLGSKRHYLLSQLAGPRVHYFKEEEEGDKTFPSSYLPEMISFGGSAQLAFPYSVHTLSSFLFSFYPFS